MNNTGLLSINGIPGSGKTLSAVNIALKHFKSENRLYKYYLSYIKKYIYNFFSKNKFLTNILLKLKKIYSNKFIRIVLKCLYLFFNFFLFLFLFVECSIYFKIFVIIYLLYFKKIIKSINNFDYNYFCSFPYKKINNVYSTFPILLDKKRNIWSNQISLFDLNSDYSFYPNCLIVIDEVQLFVDSDEFKDKNKNKFISRIAKFLQSHRHFGIKQIIFTSQSPGRIFKKARNIVVGYLKQFKIINIPIIPISIIKGIIYYDFEFYGRYIPRDREERRKLPFEYKKVLQIIPRNKVYSRYDTRYLSNYNYSKPLFNVGTWDSHKISNDKLVDLFENNDL